MQLKKQWHNIGVLGAGESGLGAALLAAKQGLRPFVSDKNNLSEKAVKALDEAGIPWEQGKHTLTFLQGCDLIVKSPGIPENAAVVAALREAGTPILSEIAFAAHFAEAKKIIAITGSNGKTTTTGLTAHLLQSAGVRAVAAGNIGKSFARVLAEGEEFDYYVLEVSSFQLDDAPDFRAHFAALLNITPDHLDRYGQQLMRYAFAKFGVAAGQTREDYFLYHADDFYTQQFLSAFAKRNPLRANQLALRLPEGCTEQAFSVEGHRYDLTGSGLLGKHNVLNALFAIRMALLIGLSPEQIQVGLNSFRNAPHRLERVAEIGGVLFINDSKATNVDAVRYALDAMDRPVIWIAGGTDKGNDYTLLKTLVKAKVKALVCLGVDNEKLKKAFADVLPEEAVFESSSTDEALACSMTVAQEGDVVLLSPACASFDLFENYEDRGNRFKQSVRQLLTPEKS